MEMQNGIDTLEDSLVLSLVLHKTKYILTYDPATPLVGIYPNELNIYIHNKTYAWMLTENSFIIVKTESPKRSFNR